ncbi:MULTISPECIES: MmcQ/YjbR family DNA-binding protein [Terrabacteria group]|uniref:MmcQ/YjbR family DNA-binding protein n=1 Tax=Bacillati TaxID=1783272 RepID=UPI00193AA63E|nr:MULTISPECIES: MmcQ/YjbR family DNA-binding protein [Terrabacteria group]MBW9212381.1 MmcQ/YjbR family DNA-binding protein [Trueperella sp. zg.1013]QRG86044.1 MmcQ/YjbR family DNA-binding protein [Bulleidia sp. zg-1006]
MQSIRYSLIKKAEKKFQISVDYPFQRNPEAQVFRIPNQKTWFALFLRISKRKLGMDSDEMVDIVNLKCDEFIAGTLRRNPGYFPAYHMKKANWISVVLDGTVPSDEILDLLEMSYDNCLKPKKQKSFGNQTWIIPSNPKYYDIHQEIEQSEDHSLLWQQYPNFHQGDTIFIYETAPSQKIIYEGYVSEENIPYQYEDEHFSFKRGMKIKIIRDYRHHDFTLSVMKTYGIGAIRGPRHLPEELIQDLRALW